MLKLRAVGSVVVATGALLSLSWPAWCHGVDVTKEVVHVKNAAGMTIKPMNEPGSKTFFQDVVGSKDPKAPITCAMFRIERSEPLKYRYDYDDTKIVLDGEITVNDGKQSHTAHKGDALMLPKGSAVTFSTSSFGLAWACGQRPAE
jgi:ethanolamine utilization protein EutQ (cupin superfamily)